MIRDEYKNQQEKKLTAREVNKIRQLGERGYFSSKVTTLTTSIKMLDFSTIFSLIACALALPMLIFNWIVGTTYSNAVMYSLLGIIICFGVWGILWYSLFRILLKRKVNKYKSEIKMLNEKAINSQIKNHEKRG